jgi:hypothetical protein
MKHKKVAAEASSLINPSRLDFWLKKNYNVLLEGKHGVGKTSIVIDAFKRNKLRWISLSGATMDPFIDFVGVPVKVKTSSGEQVIDLLRPKYIQDANPQAIFIDELNRSHKKVRNAVMELIQFKTINGQKISKDLRVVWAAINPDGEDGVYDTDRLDPAQRDRFQIQTEIPYLCDRDYFNKKYGTKIGHAAIEYWNNIPKELREKISPRRLDYALTILKDGGDARDVLPVDANVSALTSAIKFGPVTDQLNKLSAVDGHKFFADENNFQRAVNTVLTIRKYNWLMEFFPPEKLAALFASKPIVRHFTLTSLRRQKFNSPFHSFLQDMVTANQLKPGLIRKISRLLPKKKLTPAQASAAKLANKIANKSSWKHTPGSVAALPSGPIAREMTKALLVGPCNFKMLQIIATKAKKGYIVPTSKVQAKLNSIKRWATANKKIFAEMKNASGTFWSIK